MFKKVTCAALALALAILAPCRAAETAHIALHDGLVWADVDCAGASGMVRLHFVVDTGAESTCVNLAAAKRLGLKPGGTVSIAGVGGHAEGFRCAGFAGSVAGMALPGNVLVLDLSGPARGCSVQIDGLIGADFFKGAVVRIDYAHGRLTRGAEPAAGGMRARWANGVICVPVAVNGGPSRWTRLDTGSVDALDWCGGAGGASKAANSVALAMSGQSPTQADVTVGGIVLDDLPVKVRGREFFPGEAGLLGNGALSRYCVTIDGIAKRVALDRE